MPDLQTRFAQFADQKNFEIAQKTQIELSINDNIKSPQIYSLPQLLSMSEKNLWHLLT